MKIPVMPCKAIRPDQLGRLMKKNIKGKTFKLVKHSHRFSNGKETPVILTCMCHVLLGKVGTSTNFFWRDGDWK